MNFGNKTDVDDEDPDNILIDDCWLLLDDSREILPDPTAYEPIENMDIEPFYDIIAEAPNILDVEGNDNVSNNINDTVKPPDQKEDLPKPDLTMTYDPYTFDEPDADDEAELKISPNVVREARLKRANGQPNREVVKINTEAVPISNIAKEIPSSPVKTEDAADYILQNTPQPLTPKPNLALLSPINYHSATRLVNEPTQNVIKTTLRCAPGLGNIIQWQANNQKMPGNPRLRHKNQQKPDVRARITAKDFNDAKLKIVKSTGVPEYYYILPTIETTSIDTSQNGVLINAVWTPQPQSTSMYAGPVPGTGFDQPSTSRTTDGQSPPADVLVRKFYVEVNIPKDLKISHIIMVEDKDQKPTPPQ